MVDVLTKINIKCPREIVSEYAANPDNAPKWYINIKSAEWRTQKPLRIGSKITFPTGFSKWFAPFVALMMKRANQKDLKKIKNILEKHI